jgi:signal transduction histidine kinase
MRALKALDLLTPNSRWSQNKENEMLEQNTQTIAEGDLQNPGDLQGPTWGEEAPRGGKAVLNRIIKEKSTVPLFFGQTLISSLRDVGYNSTTSALCEHVDNAIQWGATEVRVYFRQTGKKGAYETDVLVLDNGSGMAPNILRFATSFGGSMVYDNRSGIGRYGMGMKTASLSLRRGKACIHGSYASH